MCSGWQIRKRGSIAASIASRKRNRPYQTHSFGIYCFCTGLFWNVKFPRPAKKLPVPLTPSGRNRQLFCHPAKLKFFPVLPDGGVNFLHGKFWKIEYLAKTEEFSKRIPPANRDFHRVFQKLWKSRFTRLKSKYLFEIYIICTNGAEHVPKNAFFEKRRKDFSLIN